MYRFDDQLVNLEHVYWTDQYKLYISHAYPDGTYTDVTDVVLTKREKGVLPDSTGISLTNKAVHILMNKMWLMGIRPSKDIASVGQAEALLEHIKTLRDENIYLHSVIDRLMAQ